MNITKTVIAVVVEIALLSCLFVSLAGANPYEPWKDYPVQPNTNLPKITILLPENNKSYDFRSIYFISIRYNITIEEPMELSSNVTDNLIYFGKITNVALLIDGKENVIFDSIFDRDTANQTLCFSGNLQGLSNGRHSLQVRASGERYYHDPKVSYSQPYWYDCPPLIYSIVARSNEVHFIVNTTLNPTPAPSVPEFSYLTILPILLTTTIALEIVRKRMQRNVMK